MTYDTISDAVTRAGGAGALLAGRYSIVRLLGNGGMGNVWLAEDTQLDNKLFAIKMLPSIMVNNKRAYAQLKAEALVAMRLVHPNIVQIRAFEENDGNPFLVMDYIDGQTLDDYLAEHTGTTGVSPVGYGSTGTTGVSPVGHGGTGTTGVSPVGHGSTGTTGILPVDVLRILRPIAAALDYAHAKGVVHRDVKPGNVMIAKDGTPYILDFGIARETQETMTRVTGKLSSGTLLYMSPEQLTGESPKPAQDIYSFAAMAYECLKGKPPFSRGNIEWQILNKEPEPLPTEGLTGNAAILAAGVMDGLAKKPENRPATCAEVLEGTEAPSGRARSPSGPQGDDFSRVEHVERVEGGNGRARSPSGPQSEGSRSHVAVKTILAAAALGLAAFGGWWWMNGREGTKRTQGTKATIETNVTNVVQVPSVTSVASPTPVPSDKPASPPEAGPTESDVTNVAVEATVQKIGESINVGKVQLWEGGPQWADRNIGAEKPEDYGYYFWWGDTVGYKRVNDAWVASDGSQSNFSFAPGNAPTRGKSNDELRNEEWITEDGVLAPEHDAAHVQWGEGWRMPTKQELDDLISMCDWKLTPRNGENGYEVRGKGAYASTSIFLPCAGRGLGTSLNGSGSYGYYWSSVPYSDYYNAYGLGFYSSNHGMRGSLRDRGQSVRPVQGVAK